MSLGTLQRELDADGEKQTHTHAESNRDRHRESEHAREREREREKQRKREQEREREVVGSKAGVLRYPSVAVAAAAGGSRAPAVREQPKGVADSAGMANHGG